MLLLGLGGAALGYFSLRGILYDQLDGGLRRLAEIEAAAATDSPDESVHFHEELFERAPTGDTALARFAEVWTLEGRPVIRTRNLDGRDLPLPGNVRRRVLESNRGEFFGFEWEGRRFRGYLYPLGAIGPQHTHHLLEVAAPTRETEAVLGRFLRRLGGLVLLGAGAATALGWWLAGHAVKPVMEIIRQAESLDINRSGSGASWRISAKAGTEELTRLVSVLNSMLERIDFAFESQRRFLADAGHEIRTPLTILRGDIEVALRKQRSREEYRAVLAQALEDLKDVSSLADDLITLARSDSGGLKPGEIKVSVEEIVERAAKRYASAAASAGVQLVCEITPGLTVRGDPALLERAVSNLLDNAISYIGTGSHVSVSARPAGPGWVEIAVTDDGPGIPEEEAPNLFERFYRGEAGRRTRRGSGLGLAIVKAIIESHGGKVELSGGPGGGTMMRLLLPTFRLERS